ncbi:MAG: Asp-tRNA(Asn)/Glu-tRNA(Gln) amidotransferase subunit GatC [Candidatus Nanopelagicales bacterium]
MADLSPEQVAHLAKLARLALTDAELDHYAQQLGVILDSVAKVTEVATGDIKPTSHAIEMSNVFRDDVVRPSFTSDVTSQNAPEWEDERFRVPRILDEE